jgi:hypothetical protein
VLTFRQTAKTGGNASAGTLGSMARQRGWRRLEERGVHRLW